MSQRERDMKLRIRWESTPALWSCTDDGYEWAPDSPDYPRGFGKTQDDAIAEYMEAWLDQHERVKARAA